MDGRMKVYVSSTSNDLEQRLEQLEREIENRKKQVDARAETHGDTPTEARLEESTEKAEPNPTGNGTDSADSRNDGA